MDEGQPPCTEAQHVRFVVLIISGSRNNSGRLSGQSRLCAARRHSSTSFRTYQDQFGNLCGAGQVFGAITPAGLSRERATTLTRQPQIDRQQDARGDGDGDHAHCHTGLH